MSKELPYFRFNCSEWLTGNIIFESYEMQGAFIRLCAELWNRNNELSIIDAYKRINNKKILDKIFELGYAKNQNDYVFISFITEEFEYANSRHSRLSEAGRKGGLSKAKAKPKPSKSHPLPTRKEKKKKRIKEDNKEIIESNRIDLFPFQEDFRDVWDNWIQYKKVEHKKTFKRIETEQAGFKVLLELSKGNSLVAEKIIQQSIANNWQGLFELKTEKDGTELTKGQQRDKQMWDYLNR